MAALDLPALALFRELQPEDRRKSRGGKGKGKGKDNRFAARARGHMVDGCPSSVGAEDDASTIPMATQYVVMRDSRCDPDYSRASFVCQRVLRQRCRYFQIAN